MKLQAITTIEPDDDGMRCGECQGPDGHGSCGLRAFEKIGNWPATFTDRRGPECLAATKLLSDLREAATEAADLFAAIREGDYEVDGFTNQPLRLALAAIDAAKEGR